LSNAGRADRLFDNRTVDSENPWPGLLPFNEADKKFFRGREHQINELMRLTGRARLTVLCGLSGLGKSSLLKAGLFPRLRRHRIVPVYIRLDFKMRPLNLAAQVADAVIKQCSVAEVEAPAVSSGETLWEYFHRKDNDFWEGNEPCTPLLAFDQWEEIFTLGRTTSSCADATTKFIEEFADLAEGTIPKAVETRLQKAVETEQFLFDRHHYKILLSVREDFLADLEGLELRISGLAVNRMRLERMNGSDALPVVNQAPHLIDPEVAEQVVRFLGAAPSRMTPLQDLEIEPALLSLVCRELNERRKLLPGDHPKITSNLLDTNLQGVLTKFFEESFEGLSPGVRPFIEENLLNADNFRDSVSMANVRRAQGITGQDIEHLIERRLVRIENLGGGERLELTHDRLTDVVRASRDARRAAEQRAREDADRQKEARAEQERHERERMEAESARLQAERERMEAESARLQAERAARRNLIVAAVMLVLMLAVGGLTLYAFRQRGIVEAQVKEASRQQAIAQASATEAKRLSGVAKEQAAEADQQRGIAKQKAAIASQNQAKAEQATKEAVQAERQTKAALQTAQNEKENADQQAREARAAQAAALESQVAESKATQAAQNANKNLTAKSAELGRSLAQSDVSEAARRLVLGRTNEALAYLARALYNDPGSLAALSLVFDILLRGRVSIPDAWPASNRITSFDHQAIDLGAPVFSAVFDPDGSRILATSKNGLGRLIPHSTKPIEFLVGQMPVNSGAFSPRGDRVAMASQDGEVQIRNLATDKTVVLKHDRPVMSVSFSHKEGPNERLWAVSASWDKTARVWDAEGGELIRKLEHDAPVTSASFSGDDNLVVTSSWNNEAIVWDAKSGERLSNLLHSASASAENGRLKVQVNDAAFDPAGGRVVTAGSDHLARVWDWRTKQPIGKPMQHDGEVNSAAFDPAGQRIVTASGDGTARLWEAATGEQISLPLMHQKNVQVMSAAFSPGGQQIVTASFDNTVQVWEVRSSASPAEEHLLQEFAQYAGGLDIDALPALKALPDRLAVLNKIRRDLQTAAANSTAAAAIRWFLSRLN
jgi:chemotaxis protein histidine kinase CheA